MRMIDPTPRQWGCPAHERGLKPTRLAEALFKIPMMSRERACYSASDFRRGAGPHYSDSFNDTGQYHHCAMTAARTLDKAPLQRERRTQRLDSTIVARG